MQKQNERLAEMVKKLEKSGVKVKVTTTPGKPIGFVGGIRKSATK